MQAATNLAGGLVSLEADGTCWTGIDPDRTYLDPAEVLSEYKRLEAESVTTAAERLATITAARDHAASLGFTDAMLAVMYPQLTEAPSE